MKNLLYAATALGAAALAYPASAALVLDESVNGGGFTNICTGTIVCSPGLTFTDPAGIVFLILGASDNSPGTPGNADVTQASVRVTNNSGATQSIVLRAGATGYTAPAGNVVLSNNISGTVVEGSPANLFSSTACANPTNAQNSCAGGFTTGIITADITGSNTAGANSDSLAIPSLGSPFSLTQITDFTLGNGVVLTYSNSADVSPVAEPASLGMLGIGLLGLAFVSSRKRVHTSVDA